MSGVLWKKKVPDRLKSSVNQNVVRSIEPYGAKCWPATNDMKHCLEVMEMKTLRWIAGVIHSDRICNHGIRPRFGISTIGISFTIVRVRWYDHVLRMKPSAQSVSKDVPERRLKFDETKKVLYSLVTSMRYRKIEQKKKLNRREEREKKKEKKKRSREL